MNHIYIYMSILYNIYIWLGLSLPSNCQRLDCDSYHFQHFSLTLGFSQVIHHLNTRESLPCQNRKLTNTWQYRPVWLASVNSLTFDVAKHFARDWLQPGGSRVCACVCVCVCVCGCVCVCVCGCGCGSNKKKGPQCREAALTKNVAWPLTPPPYEGISSCSQLRPLGLFCRLSIDW